MGTGREILQLDGVGRASRVRRRSPGIPVALLTALLLTALFAMPSAASAYMTTTGGPVQDHPHVYAIFWGSNWNAEPAAAERGRLQTLYSDLSGSAYQGILTQYWGPNGFVSSTVTATSYTDTVHGGPPTNVTEAMMETEVNEAIAANKANGWPQSPTVNDQFVLLMAPGSTYSNPKLSGACGFHETTKANIVYAWVDWSSSNCSMTLTAAHEYAEAVTDPYPNSLPRKGAWKDWDLESQNEIADLCGYSGRGFLPGGIEVPGLFDNSISPPSGGCSLGHSNPPQVAPEILTEAATGVTGHEATLHGSVHPNGLRVGKWWYKYGLFGCNSGCQQTSHNSWGKGQQNYTLPGQTISKGSLGLELEPGTTYQYQLVTETRDGNSETGITQLGEVKTFTTVGAPAVTTSPAEPYSQPAGVATVGGTVNPNGVAAEYWIEFTPDSEYFKNGWSKAISQPMPAAQLAAGSSPVEVSQQINGLTPNTQYDFRLVAKNEAGTGYGNLHLFSTGQTKAITGVAVQAGATEADLRGIVKPEGIASKYKFEYGTTTAYGQSAPVLAESVGSGLGEVAVDQKVGGLKVGTTYHFRIVAENTAVGPPGLPGNDATFSLGACKGGEGKCEWKTQTTPDLSTSTNSLSGVSCASSTMCLAVGKNPIKANPLVELWNGSEWSTSVWPNPTVPYDMTDVACTSTTACIVIGSSQTSLRAYKVKEEGAAWTKTAETLPTPSGASNLLLRSISCSSSTACTAVGSYYLESEKTYKPLVERWNGTSWALQSAPNPPSGVSANTTMSVSCASATSCVTVGTASFGVEGTLNVAESWNGTSWSLMSIPSPGTKESALEDVSCNSSSACIATGNYKETGTGQFRKPLAERWDGTAWSVLSVPSPAGAEGEVTLRGISCQATSSCMAVGRYAPQKNPNELKTLAEYWDGAKWTVQASPNSSLKENALVAVSCSSAISCTAVGSALSGSAFGEVSLAEGYE